MTTPHRNVKTSDMMKMIDFMTCAFLLMGIARGIGIVLWRVF